MVEVYFLMITYILRTMNINASLILKNNIDKIDWLLLSSDIKAVQLILF